jgi:cell division septal protein FtsQ
MPQRRGRFLRLSLKVFCVLLTTAALALFGFNVYRFGISPYFEIRKLVITGVSDSVAAEIRALTRLEANRGINLLLVREDRIRESVLKHPRIESASVAKCYPNALMIQARERQPVAVVASGALYLIDRDGYVLDTVSNLDRGQSQFPFITGVSPDQIVLGQPIPTKAVCRALDLADCLRVTSSALAKTLSEIRIGRDEGLTLVLSGGVEVRLGTAEFPDRLAALELFAQRYGNFASLEYVDLRFENQIIYRPRDGQEANPSAAVRPWSANRASHEL